MRIGVIGGSGLYQIEGLEGAAWQEVASPWGTPSDAVLTGTHEHGDDEFALAGLETAPCEVIGAPRVAAAPASLECRLVRIIDDLPTWEAHKRNVIVIGEVVGVHIRDEHLKDGRVDVLAFMPVARMGYLDDATVEAVWEMRRPGG